MSFLPASRAVAQSCYNKGMAKNYLPVARRREIESIINNLMLQTDMSYPKTPLLDIVKAAIPGVRVIEDAFDGKNIRGVIFKKSKDFENPMIAIQKSLSPEAKTFTLAHELGHYLLNHPGTKNYLIDKINYDGSEQAQKEAEAQYFAATLLMPEFEFKWLAEVLDDYKLAKRFGVTLAAVRVRKDWLWINGHPS